ncbi:MAG: hypothetical protein RBS73_17875 [Prolixibacteraceae bacterium]|nr:hypothetical protein [Prolixibacteraceae bacterium]
MWLEQNEKFIKVAEVGEDLSTVMIYCPDGIILHENVLANRNLAVTE